jgi:hypothetical protein
MGNVNTTTFGSYTLPDPELEEFQWEFEPEESVKVMLDGSLQKRGAGFRRVYRYGARCSSAQRVIVERAWRAYWVTAANFSPIGTSTDYSCVVRGQPRFAPITPDQAWWEVSMDLVEVVGHTS